MLWFSSGYTKMANIGILFGLVWFYRGMALVRSKTRSAVGVFLFKRIEYRAFYDAVADGLVQGRWHMEGEGRVAPARNGAPPRSRSALSPTFWLEGFGALLK